MKLINLTSLKSFLLIHSKICRKLVLLRDKRSVLKDPKGEANRVYKKSFGHDIDWDNPKDLIEKIYWLQFNTDTSLWSTCADKYAVRDYVTQCGLENILVKLYGKWDNENDVDFESLPSRFVAKSNNASGTVLVVKDKSKLNINKTRKKFKEWLETPFGYYSADLFYTNIKPCIIVEEFLEDNSKISSSLVDYKIWCINGEPESVWVAYDRKPSKPVKMALFDLEWKPLTQHLVSGDHYAYDQNDMIEKPAVLDEMLDVCRKLSKPFKEVRVDLYVVNNKIYFGELTFSTGYGFYTQEYFTYLGSKINIFDVNID